MPFFLVTGLINVRCTFWANLLREIVLLAGDCCSVLEASISFGSSGVVVIFSFLFSNDNGGSSITFFLSVVFGFFVGLSSVGVVPLINLTSSVGTILVVVVWEEDPRGIPCQAHWTVKGHHHPLDGTEAATSGESPTRGVLAGTGCAG